MHVHRPRLAWLAESRLEQPFKQRASRRHERLVMAVVSHSPPGQDQRVAFTERLQPSSFKGVRLSGALGIASRSWSSSLCHLGLRENRVVEHFHELAILEEQHHVDRRVEHELDHFHVELPAYFGLLHQGGNALEGL